MRGPGLILGTRIVGFVDSRMYNKLGSCVKIMSYMVQIQMQCYRYIRTHKGSSYAPALCDRQAGQKAVGEGSGGNIWTYGMRDVYNSDCEHDAPSPVTAGL